MDKQNVLTIENQKKRLSKLAEQAFEKGDYVATLRYTQMQVERCGRDVDLSIRFADVYDEMGLHEQSVNAWYKVLDECAVEDFPDVYEGLATNYLALGDEAHAAFYYNRLIDVDSTVTQEFKEEVINAFSKQKSSGFKVVYPPSKADYSKVMEEGTLALKNGNCKYAIQMLEQVEEGAADYAKAREMQAVSYLLMGDDKKAEEICLELVRDCPESAQAYSTLAAVYMEQGRVEECREIALKLCQMPLKTTEEKYKVATVACEAGLHEKAYEIFETIAEDMPYDAKTLYFRAVSAYNSGYKRRAIDLLDRLCAVYPTAVVAKYFLENIRRELEVDEDEKTHAFGFSLTGYADKKYPVENQLEYYYRLPQDERQKRIATLVEIGKADAKTALELGAYAEKRGDFQWCFDEMDGMDKDLQYLGAMIAEHARCDDFLRDVLLRPDVLDYIKMEILFALCQRNRPDTFGVVFCHIYKEVPLLRIHVGKKARKKFVEGYSLVYSKFALIKEEYAYKIADAAEDLYAAIQSCEKEEVLTDVQATATSILLLSGIKDVEKKVEEIIRVFGADENKVKEIMSIALGVLVGGIDDGEEDETD